MKKLLLPCIILLLGGGAIAVWFSGPRLPPEPTYNGQTLSVWLRDLDYSRRPADQIASNAVAQMGTNALPHLGPMLHARDSWLKTKAIQLLPESSSLRASHVPADLQRQRASQACRVLGAPAAVYLPELELMLDSTDPTTAWCGYSGISDLLLQNHSQQPERCISLLIHCLTNRSVLIRGVAASNLGGFREQASNAIPQLITMLEETDARAWESVKDSLRVIEPDHSKLARLVVPKLNAKDPILRLHTLQLLRIIRPESVMLFESEIKMLEADPDPKVSSEASGVVKKLQDSRRKSLQWK